MRKLTSVVMLAIGFAVAAPSMADTTVVENRKHHYVPLFRPPDLFRAGNQDLLLADRWAFGSPVSCCLPSPAPKTRPAESSFDLIPNART
jgi:hypothetical protein